MIRSLASPVDMTRLTLNSLCRLMIPPYSISHADALENANGLMQGTRDFPKEKKPTEDFRRGKSSSTRL